MFLPLTEENISTLFIDGSVIMLLLGVLAETGIMRKRGRADDTLFFMLIILNILMAVFDTITYLADEKSFPGARIFNMAGVTAFYIDFILMFMVWYHYCLVRFAYRGEAVSKSHRVFFIPGLVTEALIIINIFTGWIFSVDENNIYHRGILFIPMYMVIAYFTIICFISIIRYRTNSVKSNLIPIWVYVLPFVMGVIIPFVFGGIGITAPGCAMSIVFTHLGSASELVNYDEKGGPKA
ncbi:MAG: hypothetical protein K6A69_10180 [Lachnospiraceae bacterium]|nr:hypothetical protein [Lachnospiraceae bacterium]